MPIKKTCQSCGAPEATLYAYWPAVLCRSCVDQRLQAQTDHPAAEASPDEINADAFDHLLTLAQRGKSSAASGGEKQARKLVKCVLTNAVGLDARASAGIAELIAIVQRHPQRGRELIREAIR